ncbi:uncharacterized protein JN550_004728 [Neoarthrinium moseri]|uniref:uncharacterized protein n=1 Tax=Neoarthrinium moseri TaxID=1658444 RepID=UPI001FDDF1E1|nr:uncharacterized protein JN550_004728 [Neoarthrinium moseri]KAI1871283.1 hypothetical protein JN550_004728 [Neoarthrinium moseri]
MSSKPDLQTRGKEFKLRKSGNPAATRLYQPSDNPRRYIEFLSQGSSRIQRPVNATQRLDSPVEHGIPINFQKPPRFRPRQPSLAVVDDVGLHRSEAAAQRYQQTQNRWYSPANVPQLSQRIYSHSQPYVNTFNAGPVNRLALSRETDGGDDDEDVKTFAHNNPWRHISAPLDQNPATEKRRLAEEDDKKEPRPFKSVRLSTAEDITQTLSIAKGKMDEQLSKATHVDDVLLSGMDVHEYVAKTLTTRDQTLVQQMVVDLFAKRASESEWWSEVESMFDEM